MVLKPPIKWVGGKTQILDRVLGHFPREIRNYHEPFLGGGAVLLGMLEAVHAGQIRVTGHIYAYDTNPHLIVMYRHLQDSATREIVIQTLEQLTQEHAQCPREGPVQRQPATLEEARLSRESHYYWVRAQFNAALQPNAATPPDPRVSAYFIFLNKTGFRGLYRMGPRGFNVPYGNYASPTVYCPVHLRQLGTLLTGVRFMCADFRSTIPLVDAGDFVYMDPPYVPEQATSFVGYNHGGFPYHAELVALCRTMTERGIEWVMNNSDVPWVHEQYAGYPIEVLVCKRTIHSRNPGAMTNEVVIVSRR
jgi:DNA adenine methylase